MLTRLTENDRFSEIPDIYRLDMLIGTEFKRLSTETITYLPTSHAKGLNLNDLNTETSADQLTNKNTTKMYCINCDNIIYNLGSEFTEYCFLRVTPLTKVMSLTEVTPLTKVTPLTDVMPFTKVTSLPK